MLLGSSRGLHLFAIRICMASATRHLTTNHEFVRRALGSRSGDKASTPSQQNLFSQTHFPAFIFAPFRVCPLPLLHCPVLCLFRRRHIQRRRITFFSLRSPEHFAKMPIGSRGAYTFVDVLLAIILPPLGVFLKYGLQVSALHFWVHQLT